MTTSSTSPPTTPPTTIDFYYDIVCPYAYLGSTQIAALAARAGARLRWKPMLLGGVFRAISSDGSGEGPMGTLASAKARLNLLDMRRWAAHFGVSLALHPRHPMRSVDAMRLCHVVDGDDRVKVTHALYRAYFVEHRDLDDRAVLRSVLERCALDPALADRVDDPAIKDALRRTTDEAVADGAFGAPAIVIDTGGVRTLYWGQDRLGLVEEALGLAPTPAASPSDRPVDGARVVDFFYDFSSPYAYLGSTQIERVAARQGAVIRWKPFLLGALFKAIGTPIVPMHAASEPKRRYYARDVLDWARHWQVPFSWPTRFPMRTVLPLRVALSVAEADRPRLSHAIYRAYWVEDRDIADAAVLADVLREIGLDDAPLKAAEEAPAKAALTALTDEAVALGLCGAPSFLVRGHLFWGQDRLGFVEKTLAGWDPPT
jgi:2-hydroxychromene-2-carboxylate isomerase